MASFADITHELQNIMDVDSADFTDEQSQAWYSYMDELTKAREDKIDAFCSFIRVEIAKAKAIRDESAYLAKKAKAIENKVDWLKSHYMSVMAQSNTTKVEGTTHSISIRNSKSVSIENGALETLPDAYKKVTIEPLKAEIKKALEAGERIDGCEIVERQTLNIR